MTFRDAIKQIVSSANSPLTPQEIRSQMKSDYPEFYGTESQQKNVEKGHYQHLDHALLAKIYSTVRSGNLFNCDMTQKPMLISLGNSKKMASHTRTTKPSSKRVDNLSNMNGLISNIKHYYKKSLDVFKDFGGPSLYFHIEAIKAQKDGFLLDRHIEMIYATLASWGMHKMGDPAFTKAKLVDFSTFKKSILNHKSQFNKLLDTRMESCNLEEYDAIIDQIENIYYNLKVSISDATIVANSKTLAHIIPHLIPPIDRQYTIRFFTQGNRNFFTPTGQFRAVSLPQSIDDQFQDFKKYCMNIKSILDQCDRNLFTIEKESFNTSYPKIMDNLIMAYIKDTPKPSKQ